MLQFHVDQTSCIQCGACSGDCPSGIITMTATGPVIAADKQTLCYRCQHCLAVCPAGALSIFGLQPANSIALASQLPSPEQMAALIKGRRSVRQYAEEDLAPELITRLLKTAWHAPTGVNARQVRFTVFDTRAKLQHFREIILQGLAELGADKSLPPHMERFLPFVQAWREEQRDVIFRNAPHLVLASAPRDAPTPVQDCLIALSYFELYAQTCQVGTVWAGLAYLAVTALLPRLQTILGLPADHQIGYAMLFGKPGLQYARGVQHENAPIHYVTC